MITSNMIYWLTRLDSICSAMAILFGIFIIATICWAACFVFCYSECNYDDSIVDCKNLYLKKLIFIPVTALIMLFVGIFVPTTKEACAMYVIPKIANNENVQNLSKEVVDLAHAWIDELKPKHEEKPAEAKK